MLKSTDWTGLSASIVNASGLYRHSALSSIEQSLTTAKHFAEIYEREKLLEAALGDPLSRALRQYADHQLLASSQVDRLLGSHFDVRHTSHSLASALAAEQSASVLWKEQIALGGAAFRAAELAHQTRLPELLESHRSTVDLLALKLVLGGRREHWSDAGYLSSFSAASALAELHNENRSVTRLLSEANYMLVDHAIRFGSLGEYRALLDSAGLTLPRWPQLRLLRKSEKTARFYSRLREHKEPSHVRKAKSLVRQYELTLRAMIDELMTTSLPKPRRWWFH